MWVYDAETLSFLTVNDAAILRYGYTRDEFLSMSIRDIRLPEDAPGLLHNDPLSSADANGVGVRRHRKKDGSSSFVEITTHTLDFAGKRAELVMIHDVTERKKLEDQLRHAQKMEAVGKLAGGVAHDFNNILTAIIGYGNLVLMKMGPGDPMRHNVGEILAAAQRAASLTQGLLTFSRRQVINPVPVNVNQVIERVGSLLERLIGEDIKLETKLAGGELVVIADSGQLDQVLMNLATNARDAMPNGGTLNIETRRIDLDDRFIQAHNYGKRGAYAVIAISDNGTGMDAGTVAQIFEPFFTTKEMGRGTGLGLSLVYGIVKQNNGYINVYSEPGKGTTFKLYLPMATTSVDAWKAEGAEVLKRGTETVLVAEDDETIRRLVRSVLGDFGYTVIEARDGEDAVEKIGRHRGSIQLLLLDVIMPKKSGREVYEEARKQMPGVKALFLSGYTADIVRKRGLLEAGQDFIAKPVSPSELLQKIRNVLDRSPDA
jgi:two-component system cell cycle sensor histidine kinase/response regulator CckA